MNFNLQFLIFKKLLFSSFIINSKYYINQNFQFSNNFFTKQTFNFLFFNSNFFNLNIKNSKFNSYLSPIIKIQSINIKSKVLTLSNIYENIHPISGSAIYHISTSKLLILDSFFNNCASNYDGGAIYSTSLEFICERCCFFKCHQGLTSTYYGSSIHHSNSGTSYLNLLSSIFSPYLNLNPWHDQYSIWYSSSISLNLNVSYCSAEWCCGPEHLIPQSSQINYLIVYSNIAGCSIGLYQSPLNSNYQYFQAINNTSNKGLFYVHTTYCILLNSVFISNNGLLTTLHQNPTQFQIQNCLFDFLPEWGTGLYLQTNNQFNLNERTTILMNLLNTFKCINYNKNLTNKKKIKYKKLFILIYNLNI